MARCACVEASPGQASAGVVHLAARIGEDPWRERLLRQKPTTREVG